MSTHVKSMTEGHPAPLIFKFALPLMLGGIFQQFYTVVDTMIVGKALGVGALAAVGATDWLNWTILGILISFPQGFSILMAREFGAGNYKALRRVIAQSVNLSLLVVVITAIASQLVTVPVLQLMQTPADIIDTACSYVRVVFLGVPVVMAYNLFSCILRSLGDSRTPLIAIIIAAITNVLLDLLFVLVFRWGVAGAAFATILAQLLSAVFCLLAILKIPFLNLERGDFVPDGRLCRKLLFLGLPLTLQYTLIHVGGMILQSVINGFGVLFIAGYTATNKIYGTLEIAATSYGSAMTTFAGQNLGAGNIRRIRQGTLSSMLVGLATSTVIAVTILLLGKPLLSLFVSGTPEEITETLRIAYQYLAIMCVFLPTLYALYIIRSSVQGMGNTVLPMVSGFAECAMRLSAAFFLPAYIGEVGIFLAEPAAWIGADVILIISYYVTVRKLERIV